jgi:hypothetical protein
MVENTKRADNNGADRGEAIVQRSQKLAKQCFDEHMSKLLDVAHRKFFLDAEKASNQHEQGRMFEALKAIEQHRDAFLESFDRSLSVLFADLRPESSAGTKVGSGASLPDHHDQMRLVDDERLERSLTITHVAARIKMRFPMALHALKQRFAVLTSAAPDAVRNPLGADEIGEALLSATQAMQLASHAEVAFFRLFEQHVMPAIGQLYDNVNELMIEAGVLPNISYQSAQPLGSTPPKPGPKEAPPPEKAESSASPSDRSGQPGSEPSQRQVPASGAPGQETEQLIQHIHQILERSMQRATPTAPSGTPQVSAEIMNQALSNIAKQPHQRTRFEPPQSRDMLMRNLVKQISQATGTAPEDVRLPAAQSASVDLIGRLFEQVSSDSVMRPNTLKLMGPLQVPLAQLAMRKPRCLSDESQPARQVMTAIAELSNLLPDNDDRRDRGNQEVSALLSEAISEHGSQPDKLFDALAEQLEAYTSARRRKAELAERRQVEASKGREKLIVAREEAREEVHRLLDRYHPGRTMREVLQKCWIDVMALALLRHGRQSDYWAGTLETGEIIAAIDSQGADSTEWQPDFNGRWQSFTAALDTGLKLIGLFPEGLQVLHRTLTEAREWQLSGALDEQRPSSLDAGFVVKAQHVGDTALAAAGQSGKNNKSARKRPQRELPAEIKQQLEAIKQLPYGTWFDIEMPDGSRQRVKLAWHSTQTGHCLFVNHRGAKCGTDDVLDLAHLMHAGRAQAIAPDQHRSLINRALTAIRRQLGKLSGRFVEGGKGHEHPAVG